MVDASTLDMMRSKFCPSIFLENRLVQSGLMCIHRLVVFIQDVRALVEEKNVLPWQSSGVSNIFEHIRT